MEYTYSDELYSDLHKDAYGFRPTENYHFWWNRQASQDEKQQEWDRLILAMERRQEEKEAYEKQALEKFEASIQKCIDAGADSRETAIRWVVQSLKLEDHELMYGGDIVCYKLSLPFHMASIFEQALA